MWLYIFIVFNGFQYMNPRTQLVKTAEGGPVALECDILTSRPPSRIEWFVNESSTPIAEILFNYQIVYIREGRYLFISELTSSQRNGRYHCEVIYPFLTPQRIRAPTTYILNESPDANAVTYYIPIEQIPAVSREPLVYIMAVGAVDSMGKNRITSFSCDSPAVHVQNFALLISGLSGDINTGLVTLDCDIGIREAEIILATPLTFLVSRKS